MHIIKPQISSDFAYSDVNEAVRLSAIRRLGVKASVETIKLVGGVWANVIERYDRAVTLSDGVERFHQEDSCQILRCMPVYKCEQNGGSTVVAIARTIHKHASVQDISEFVKQLAFNIAAVDIDAHGKNFSMLKTIKGCSLAPAYDVAPYLYKVDLERNEHLSSPVQIGGEYRFMAIREPRWMDFASDAGLDADTVLGIMSCVSQNAADAVSEALEESGRFAAGTPVADSASRVNAFRVSRAIARQKPFRAQN